MKHSIVFSQEVKEALDTGKPVVALESTIISHGFPYPDNLNCALTCEKIIRETGCVPATIGIVDGVITVGLSEAEIKRFATEKGTVKSSRRDLPYVVSKKLNGATTVSATMMICQMAGIPVFATGGIGGVHRQDPLTMDISADLVEFKNSDVVVVCAGAKSILDIPKTREFLETMGVLVCGYQTSDFPSFYNRKSGTKVDVRMEDEMEIARFMKTKKDLAIPGGTLVANPIPEKDQLDQAYVEAIILEGIKQAKAEGIYGKEETPYLLSYLYEKSEGLTAKANQALVYNNSLVAGKIAKAYSQL